MRERQVQAEQNYKGRQQHEEQMRHEFRNRIQMLEQQEAQLVGKLRETTNKQRLAYQNLDNIVSTGYDYYFQSLAEKRQMQDRRAKAHSIADLHHYNSIDSE